MVLAECMTRCNGHVVWVGAGEAGLVGSRMRLCLGSGFEKRFVLLFGVFWRIFVALEAVVESVRMHLCVRGTRIRWTI